MYKKIKRTLSYLLFISFAVLLTRSFSGCGSDTTAPPPPPSTPSDTNVIIFDSLVVNEFFNQNSLAGVDLWQGKVTTAADTLKDMQLVDSLGSGRNFYFRSGDLSLLTLVPGKQTRFNNIYDTMTQSQFDTLTRIPDSDNLLDSLDFTQDDTQFWGYFNAPIEKHHVYSFYLKGKFAEGITPKRVYGVIYLRSATLGGPSGFNVTISVRINKNSENWFHKH